MGQVLMKFGLNMMLSPAWSWEFVKSVLLNWQFVSCGVCYGIGSLLWMYIVKNYPLSMAYPLISLSYVFGMIAAVLFFHETVSLTKWIGVFFIITGCIFVVK